MSVTLRTNFGRRMGKLAPVLLAGSWGLTIAALIGAGTLFGMRAQSYEALPTLRAQLKKLQAHHEALTKNKATLPSQAALVSLQHRVSVINKIVGSKGHPIPELLSRLETLLPPRAWLVSLHQRRALGEVQLVAASTDVGELTEFLKRLENDPYFSDALLTKQSHGRSKGEDAVQFEIRLMERMR